MNYLSSIDIYNLIITQNIDNIKKFLQNVEKCNKISKYHGNVKNIGIMEVKSEQCRGNQKTKTIYAKNKRNKSKSNIKIQHINYGMSVKRKRFRKIIRHAGTNGI